MSCVFAVMSVAAKAQVYVCGTFNGWDPKTPVEMVKGADGVYTAVIDFAAGAEFKLSTEKGVSGNGWTEFDRSMMYYETNPAPVDEWLTLKSGYKAGNLQAPSTGKYALWVNLTEMTAKFTASTTPTEAYSGTLPVLFIDTENSAPITSKETYLTATYHLDPMGVEGVKAIGTAEAPLTMQIRGRGNFTWSGFDKKPYRLKLTDKQPLLGMNKSKHWALLAHADDHVGFMRNFTGFTASELLHMPWTPASQPCEVVLNGEYIGLYFLTETVRVDKDRVNVTEQADLATVDVDGGWLVEIDNYDSDPHVTVYENGVRSQPIWFTYKSPEELSVEQDAYLTAQMKAIDAAIYAPDKNNAAPLEALVDFDVLARYYIAQEIMDDTESFHGSCYLNRQRGAAEKWKFGPVWDFGNGLQRGDSEKFIWQDPTFHQVWIGEIYRFPAFVAAVKKVWAEFLGENGDTQLTSLMNTFSHRIAAAASCDAQRWPDYGNANELQAAALFRAQVERRIDWLKSQWGNTGVDDIVADTAPTAVVVTGGNGYLVIRASRPCTVTVSTLIGSARTVKVQAGVTEVAVPAPGIYVVVGQKVIVH